MRVANPGELAGMLRGFSDMLRFGTTAAEVSRNGEGGAGKAYAVAVETKRFADLFTLLAGGAEALRGSAANPSLKFGSDDLVNGPSAQGKLRELQQSAGGKLLTDLDKPNVLDWKQFSVQTLDEAASSGGKVHFDLTNVKDLQGILKGTSYVNEVTSAELIHIKNNWSKFSNTVTFYQNGKVVKPWQFEFKN